MGSAVSSSRRNPGAQPGFLLGGKGLVLLAAQLLHFCEHGVNLGPGTGHQLGSLLPGSVQFPAGFLLHLAALLFRFFFGLGGFPPELVQLLPLEFQLLAAGFQVLHHVFKLGVFLRNQPPGPVYNLRGHAQAQRNGKGVGAARHPDEQPVRGPQGGHVKLAAAVLHPGVCSA